MLNFKIVVNNEAENKEIQELSFQLGAKWLYKNLGQTVLPYVYKPMLESSSKTIKYIFCNDGVLGVGTYEQEEHFNSHTLPQYTIQHLRDLVVLKRNKEVSPETLPTNTQLTKQDRLGYFSKYLDGKRIQWKLDSNPDSQWHNLTNKSLDVFTRDNLQLRDEPKYVTLNCIEFKSKAKLLSYVENNFDLGE